MLAVEQGERMRNFLGVFISLMLCVYNDFYKATVTKKKERKRGKTVYDVFNYHRTAFFLVSISCSLDCTLPFGANWLFFKSQLAHGLLS